MNTLKYSTAFWVVVLLSLLLGGMLFSPVSGDAPFYLSVSRDIANGLVPYQDINLAYTPLMMYFNAAIWAIFGQPPYAVFLFFQYAVILAGAGLLYQIGLRHNLDKAKALFVSIFFSICILSSDGSYVNLEVYSVFFVLLAYLMLLKKHHMLCGLALGLTFFCKQYGILNFVPFGLLILTSPQPVRNIARFALGGAIPLVLFLIYFCAIERVAFSDLIFQLSGQGYGEKSMAQTKTIAGVINGAKVFLLMLVPLVFLRFNPLKNRTYQIFIVGIAFVLIPVAVQHFQHYFINAFPYVAILIIMQWRENNINWIAVNVSLAVVSGFLILRLANYTDKAQSQKTIAKTLLETYPAGTQIYLKGQTNYLYVLNDYGNPSLQKAGYAYNFVPDAGFLDKHIVLTFDKIPQAIPERITTVNGQKIYEY